MAFNPGQNKLDGGQFDNLISQLYAQSSGARNSSGHQQQVPTQNNAQYYGGDSTPLMNHPPPPQQYAYSSISTPLTGNSTQRPQHTPSTNMSQNDEVSQGRANPQSNADRTASLLNLLKFSGPGSNQSASISLPQTTSTITEGRSSFGAAATLQASSDGRNSPSTDLMAVLMGNSHGKPGPSSHSSQSQISSRVASSTFRPQQSPPSQDTQHFLLKLLNKKPAQTNASPQDTSAKQQNEIAAPDVAELSQALEYSSLENMNDDSGKAPIVFGSSEPSSAPVKGLFTYQDPFEELQRSSPRNRTSQQASPAGPSALKSSIQVLKHPRHNTSSEVDGYDRETDERGQATDSPAYTKRKMETMNPTSPVTILPDGRTGLEALIGIGAPNKGKETVAGALNEVGEVVNKQVEAAIEEAEKEEAQAEIEKDMRKMMNAKTEEEFEASAQIAAQAIKKELDKDVNENVLHDSLPTPVADAVKEIIDDTAQGPVADSWESADAEEGSPKESLDHVVKVYNFPMKPFITLTIYLPLEERASIRPDSTMGIARLKKDFDQIDRTLVTATDTFMIYCMPKTGGIRVIHQGNGTNSRLFSKYDDRIFSIAASVSGDTEVVVGTGVSNTVYWAIISQGEYDEDFVPETKSFALPPSQTHDGESPGVLKTRVRKSGSHTEFFAVGRGKSIHIIQPDIILKNKSYFLNSNDRIVDTEKYLNDHAMVINTGKAGKDFTFSPDDTMIASLDKAGKVKLWDIRPFTSKWTSTEAPIDFPQPGEIKEPLMTFTTTAPSEKSWATSVMFVDKPKPYQKGGPLRYLLIGMKQNHTLQLWDLALGRAVQEINLPHENESDAVCSVLYHPHTSIIVVGHPTRNSIFFIHLSAPKYGLSRIQNQAEYIEHLISRDPALLRPDSTAVMSGIREFSFSSSDNSVLRSLEILGEPASCNLRTNDPVLFELYAMHSKGMTCIPIKQEDLGWGADNRVLYPVDAEKIGAVKIDNLVANPSPFESVNEPSRSSPATSSRASGHLPPAKESLPRDSGKKVPSHRDRGDRNQPSEVLQAVRPVNPATKSVEKATPKSNGGIPEISTSSTEKSTRNRKKKNSTVTGSPFISQSALKNEASPMEPPTILARNGSPAKSQKASIPASVPAAETAIPLAQSSAAGIDQQAIDSMVNSITPEISRVMRGSLQDMYARLDEDKRVMAATGDAKHEAVLRLVSNSLGEGLQRTIEGSIRNSIETQVLPTIIDITTNTLNNQLGGTLASQINKSIPKELQTILPEAVYAALQNPVLLRAVADAIIDPVESRLVAALEERILPTLMSRFNQTAQSVANIAQQQATAQLQAFTHQINKDNAQIAQLNKLVTNLSSTVSAMAEVQSKFQEEFLKNQYQGNGHRSTPSNRERVVRSPVDDSPPVDEQLENALQAVQAALQAGELETAFVAWVQSSREEQIFRTLFSKSTELDFISQLSPLVLLTVGCVVTADLVEFEPIRKLDWLERIFQCFPVQSGYLVPMENNVREILPNTIMIIKNRLEEFYNRVITASRGQQTPLLKRLGGLITYAQHIRNQYGNHPGSN